EQFAATRDHQRTDVLTRRGLPQRTLELDPDLEVDRVCRRPVQTNDTHASLDRETHELRHGGMVSGRVPSTTGLAPASRCSNAPPWITPGTTTPTSWSGCGRAGCG